ncbi:porin [Aureibaculum conchae]|uniref:porin n=1 Tax=Aureibaculum sp. 2308TA14-22 TaxID=3108392 RepID=UPI003399BBC6
MKPVITFLLFTFSSILLYAQSNNKLKLNFDESGNSYIKANIASQLWLRYAEMNPGTTINDAEIKNTYEVSMRRLRIGISAQLTPKLLIVSSFGGNNLNYNTDKTFQFKVLDLYAEYKFSDAIKVGIGKSGHQGLSRVDSRSFKSLLTLDAPIFSLSTVNKIDDEARNLGLFAKGQIGKVDYRFAIQNPDNYKAELKTNETDFAKKKPEIKWTGYLKYQFLEKEGNNSAYHTSTYLGSKKVLNLGVGFTHLPKATYYLPKENVSDMEYYDLNHWAVDLFYDTPINKENNEAITSYLSYISYNFGKDYIRNVGANNPATGVNQNTSFNGKGNAFPMMGTGNTLFFQMGYLMSNTLLGTNKGQLQPNISIQYSDFDKLDDPMLVYDFGINWYFSGHNNKLSLGFQNRPIFNTVTNEIVVTERKNMAVLQYQMNIN